MTKMMTRTAIGVAILAGLAGCGDVDSLSYGDLKEISRDLEIRYGEADDTEADSMPTSGAGTYTGVALFGPGSDTGSGSGEASLSAQEAIAGQIALTANFGSRSITGQITNLRNASESNPYYDGTLNVSAGSIEDTTFEGRLNGSLNSARGFNNFSGTMEGSFVGGRANAMVGDIEGELTDSLSGDKSKMNGSFIAEAN